MKNQKLLKFDKFHLPNKTLIKRILNFFNNIQQKNSRSFFQNLNSIP